MLLVPTSSIASYNYFLATGSSLVDHKVVLHGYAIGIFNRTIESTTELYNKILDWIELPYMSL